MKYMQKEMQEQFKEDILSGKIWGLRLVKTPNDVIRNNAYADIYGIPRQIVNADENKFYLKTRINDPYRSQYNGRDYVAPTCLRKTEEHELLEAHYDGFDYYDGSCVQSSVEIPAAVNSEDIVLISEQEVIWSY